MSFPIFEMLQFVLILRDSFFTDNCSFGQKFINFLEEVAVTAERYNINVDSIVDFDHHKQNFTLNDSRTITPIGVGKAVVSVSGNDLGSLLFLFCTDSEVFGVSSFFNLISVFGEQSVCDLLFYRD